MNLAVVFCVDAKIHFQFLWKIPFTNNIEDVAFLKTKIPDVSS